MGTSCSLACAADVRAPSSFRVILQRGSSASPATRGSWESRSTSKSSRKPSRTPAQRRRPRLERISKPPPEEAGAGEADEAEKHLGLRLVAGDEPAAAHEPGEEPFDEPASFVAVAQLPAVLRLDGAGALVRGDHLDAALLQLSVDRIA